MTLTKDNENLILKHFNRLGLFIGLLCCPVWVRLLGIPKVLGKLYFIESIGQGLSSVIREQSITPKKK
jgi:hypothetical protein